MTCSENTDLIERMSKTRQPKRFETIALVEAYWQNLRGSRLVPLRSEVDPRGFETALDFAFVVEQTSAGVARFRLAGRHFHDVMGMDVRGMPVTSLFATKSREEFSGAIAQVFQGPEVLSLDLMSAASATRPALTAQMVLLPLRSDLGDVSRAMGCFQAKGEITHAPRRFALSGSMMRRQLTATMSNKVFEQPAQNPTLVGLAETQAPFTRSDKQQSLKSERPWLKLVRDTDT